MATSFLLPACRPNRPAPQSAAGRVVMMGLLISLGCAGCDAGPSADSSLASDQPAADPRRGQRLLAQYQCGSCHAIPGVEAARGSQGPSLRAFGKRSYIAGHIPNRPDALARWLVAPSALVPDTAMPSMGVSLADARDMAAYLRGLE